MTVWRWSAVFPPRGMTLDATTAVVRVLSGRPRFGVLGLHPLVVFELWLEPERARWLVGMDERLADRLPGEFRSQCPTLTLVPVENPPRPHLVAGRELRFRSMAYPVRLDTAEGVTMALLRIREDLHNGEAVVVQFVVGPSKVAGAFPQQQTPLDILGFTTPAEPDSDDRQAWRRKLAEPLLGIRGRIGAVAADTRRASRLTLPVFSALTLANDRHGRVQVSAQSQRIAAQILRVMGRVRTWSSVINGAELAVLLGWNIGDSPATDVGSRFAPAPAKLLITPGHAAKERTLGVSLHPAEEGKLVRLPVTASRHGVHVIGPTGSGKSTLLAGFARADTAAGRALLVMEPRGDLVRDVLAGIPPERRNDVVVIEPGSARCVGLNPLRGPRGEAERRADQLVHLFEAWWGTNIGPRSRDVLLHCLIALARLPDGTLADVPPLLSQPVFRRAVLAKVSDPLVLAPFFAWFEATSAAEKSQIIAPVLNKLRALLSPPATRQLLGQAMPKFEIESLFRERRIVLVDLNAGVVGPDNADLIGGIVLHELWMAAQRRALIPAERRHVTMVIIDEVQRYLDLSVDFGDVLANSRGLGLAWTLAHQHLGQLSPRLQDSVLTNARSRVVFRPTKDASQLAVALGGGLAPDDLGQLQAYEACARLLVNGTPSEPFGIRTQQPGQALTEPDELRRASQERYGVDGVTLDEQLAVRWHGGMSNPDAPIGVKQRRPRS